jgi:MerR family transcriptional regulator, redox-sensitive transcriptional activator SoxR
VARALRTIPGAAHLTISQVAKAAELRTSAIRYYERIGILPRAERVSGRRRFGETTLHRLAVVQRAREAGFTLREIRTLFGGFRDEIRADERWRRLAGSKLAELDAAAARIESMRGLLVRLRTRCHCRTLDACGRAMYEHGLRTTEPAPAVLRPSRKPAR